MFAESTKAPDVFGRTLMRAMGGLGVGGNVTGIRQITQRAPAVRNRRAGKAAIKKPSFAEGFCELRFKLNQSSPGHSLQGR